MVNRILAVCLVILTLMIFGIAMAFYKQLTKVKEVQMESNLENVKTNQFLLSTINWSTQRHKMILFMRDQIIKEWERIGAKKDFNKAFIKAEAIMKECERYPSVEPFAMLAVQRVESSYLDTLVSIRGARGSWQFVTSTAMLLCQATGITYSDKVYVDPVVSTRLAGKYFDVLYAAYPDSIELARFADYNGGPQQASYYLYCKQLLSTETKKFVDSVSVNRNRFRQEFVEYRPEKSIKVDGGIK